LRGVRIASFENNLATYPDRCIRDWKVDERMDERSLLMIPGPTNVAPSVLSTLARPTLSHVSGTFADILKQALADLRQIFKTKTGLILPLAGTGTLGSEVALANVIEPNDKVLAICNGYFADRFAEVAATLGAKVDRVSVPWGSVADPNEVEKKLSTDNYKALLVVHVDTSTGAANPIEKLGRVARSRDILHIVDAVCSLGGMDVQSDAWGIDVCFTGSQKALAVPPGLAIVSFGRNALKAREERKTPMGTYYGDLKRWAPAMEDPTKYFATHPVNMIYALHHSCNMILSEGLDARFARHAKMAEAFRAAMTSIGLHLLCNENESAKTLTVPRYPSGVIDSEFRKTMAEKYGIVVAGGLGPLSQKVFRVGHMGNINRNDLLATIAAVEGSLSQQNFQFTSSGVAAANRTLAAVR
jgi:alanine-glyoxylate transaminase/serine-glyoxylate transaminase/serine-pyruvate transaminase